MGLANELNTYLTLSGLLLTHDRNGASFCRVTTGATR